MRVTGMGHHGYGVLAHREIPAGLPMPLPTLDTTFTSSLAPQTLDLTPSTNSNVPQTLPTLDLNSQACTKYSDLDSR